MILLRQYKNNAKSKNLKIEDMSEAFVRALCAVHGYSIVNHNHDNDGVGFGIRCKDKPCEEGIIRSPEVEVQLKWV